jgi:hypothetical protein
MEVRYTVCIYYPDLTRPESAYPFAVLAASAKDIALTGVNVADAYDLHEKHPLGNAVAEQTFRIVVRRIQTAMQQPGLHSCLDVLDHMVESNRSNIQYRSFIDVQGDDAKNVADLVFAGIRQQWGANSKGEFKQEVSRFHQMLLRLDEQDRTAVISGMPAYNVFALRYSAVELVRSATVMYRGLRREGTLRRGFALCGPLSQAFDNSGKSITAPAAKVFVVYADPEGYVFDWDWVDEDPNHPGYPVDAELRFVGDPETVLPEVVLIGVDDLVEATFNPQQAWPSLRGDCIFCYFSDEFAYADRINNDLTVFRSVMTKEPTGFKIKNVRWMLEKGYVRLGAPDLAVEVQAFLLATMRLNPDTKIDIYSLLIGAWMRRVGHTEPPKITIPGGKEPWSHDASTSSEIVPSRSSASVHA